jgi:hypothetical protein
MTYNYKIFIDVKTQEIIGITRILNGIPNAGIPLDPANSDYQQFIQDVAEQGIEIVEGPDIVEPDYATLRSTRIPIP